MKTRQKEFTNMTTNMKLEYQLTLSLSK